MPGQSIEQDEQEDQDADPGEHHKGAAALIAPYRNGAVLGIFLILLVGGLKLGQALLVPVFAALLTGLLLGKVQDWLERLAVSPALGAGAIMAVLLAIVLGSVRLLFIPFEEWSAALPEIYAALKRQLLSVRELLLTIEQATDAVQETTGIDASGEAMAVSAPGILSGLAVSVPATIGQLILFSGVLFFYLASRSRLSKQLAEAGQSYPSLSNFKTISETAENSVSTYLSTVSLINLGLAVATGVLLALVGLPNAWFWGTLAGLLNFVPYVGPLLLTFLLLGAGLLQEGTFLQIISPAVVFFAVNFLEANFVTPTVLGRSLLIEPLFVFLSLGFWLWLWGPVGALMAVPLLLVIQAVVSHMLSKADF
ncbi:AI-2E family transporter [Roseibium polysiphoniae]|uniref:AI-2E family transporter n=1 Tax=Roseibium polysiphoniae TaxID=2571221 RepID=UPI0032969943